MKKNLIVLMFFLTLILRAQHTEVKYTFIDALVLGDKIGERYNAVLKFTNQSSEYVVKRNDLESIVDIDTPRTYTKPGSNGGYMSPGLMVIPNGFQVITNNEDNIMYSNIYLRNSIYLKENIPELKWVINKNKTKKINDILCYSATTYFRGRKYIAWFTYKIKTSFGPWKLHGLPGLIIEAYDEGMYLYWFLNKVANKPGLINKNLVDENNNVNKTFLSLNDYIKTLNNLYDSMNERNIISSKSAGFDPKPLKKSTIFLEIFNK